MLDLFSLVLRTLHNPCNTIAYCIASSYCVNLCCDTSTCRCIRHAGNTDDTTNPNYVNSSLMGHVASPPTGLEPSSCTYPVARQPWTALYYRLWTWVPVKKCIQGGVSIVWYPCWRKNERSLFQFLNYIIFSLCFAQQSPNYTKPQQCPQKLIHFPTISHLFLKEAFTSAGH